jgi:hypothetical protein
VGAVAVSRNNLGSITFRCELASLGSFAGVISPRGKEQTGAIRGGDFAAGHDSLASMKRRNSSTLPRPLQWQPLVSQPEWSVLAGALKKHPQALDDLRVVLTQLSPGVRVALIANLLSFLRSEERPTRAVWTALAVTGEDVRLCSAEALGRLHALAEDAPGASVRPLRRRD